MLNIIPHNIMKDLCLGILNLAVNIRLFYQSSQKINVVTVLLEYIDLWYYFSI